jgi:hypothetical protein
MQEYLLVAKSFDRLDVIRLRGGLLHPRWPMLSGLFTILSGCVGYILWYFVPCSAFLSFFCESYTWPFFVQILLIDLLFLLCWVAMFVLGYVAIEAPRRPSGRLKKFLRSISDAEVVRWLFSFYGALLLLGIIASIVLWFLRHVRMQPAPLALAMVVLLIATWTQAHHVLCQRRLIEEKKLEPTINAIVSSGYLFSCLPWVRRIFHLLRNDQVYPGTMIVGMQPSSQVNIKKERPKNKDYTLL